MQDQAPTQSFCPFPHAGDHWAVSLQPYIELEDKTNGPEILGACGWSTGGVGGPTSPVPIL